MHFCSILKFSDRGIEKKNILRCAYLSGGQLLFLIFNSVRKKLQGKSKDMAPKLGSNSQTVFRRVTGRKYR